jgi:hypothetical protein
MRLAVGVLPLALLACSFWHGAASNGAVAASYVALA